MTNREFANSNATFREACAIALIPPTPRQAGKWRRAKGKAWKVYKGILKP